VRRGCVVLGGRPPHDAHGGNAKIRACHLQSILESTTFEDEDVSAAMDGLRWKINQLELAPPYKVIESTLNLVIL
jgi:hypothetical protein